MRGRINEGSKLLKIWNILSREELSAFCSLLFDRPSSMLLTYSIMHYLVMLVIKPVCVIFMYVKCNYLLGLIGTGNGCHYAIIILHAFSVKYIGHQTQTLIYFGLSYDKQSKKRHNLTLNHYVLTLIIISRRVRDRFNIPCSEVTV